MQADEIFEERSSHTGPQARDSTDVAVGPDHGPADPESGANGSWLPAADGAGAAKRLPEAQGARTHEQRARQPASPRALQGNRTGLCRQKRAHKRLAHLDAHVRMLSKTIRLQWTWRGWFWRPARRSFQALEWAHNTRCCEMMMCFFVRAKKDCRA